MRQQVNDISKAPSIPLPPPVQDHLIQLLAYGLHVGIGKASVQGADAVRVRTGAANGTDF